MCIGGWHWYFVFPCKFTGTFILCLSVFSEFSLFVSSSCCLLFIFCKIGDRIAFFVVKLEIRMAIACFPLCVRWAWLERCLPLAAPEATCITHELLDRHRSHSCVSYVSIDGWRARYLVAIERTTCLLSLFYFVHKLDRPSLASFSLFGVPGLSGTYLSLLPTLFASLTSLSICNGCLHAYATF